MSERDEPEARVQRIHGPPEAWLRDFVNSELSKYAGRVFGFCVHLEITCEDDPESSFCRSYFNWPSTAQMQGRLHTTITQIGLRHLSLPERGEGT